MTRRNQEAEDEAYAQALQDEYRKEFLRQKERNTNSRSSSEPDAGDRSNTTTTSTSNTDSKKNNSENRRKKGKGKKKSKSKGSKNSRTRSRSRDSDISASGEELNSRRRRRGNSNKASAPIESGDDWISTYHPEQETRSTPIPVSNGAYVLPPYTASDYEQTMRDEEYARMVQSMIQREDVESERRRSGQTQNQSALRSQKNTSSERDVQRQFSFKDSNSAGGTEPSTDDDEAVARRIQQELADAEYAQHISNLERDNAASHQVVLSLERQNQLHLAQQQEQEQAPPKSCIKKWGTTALCIVIAVTIPLLYVFDVFEPSDIPFLGDLFQDDWAGAGNITFDMINGTRVPRLPPNAIGWANKGKGLELDIINACSDEWQPYVQTAIANWDNGYPVDSLTLYTSRDEYDPSCQFINGKLKICNGDYGDTRWRGLNEVRMLRGGMGTIVTSTARLNEFYLNREGEAQKLYTCCHELGHGFGLPHWDEDFFNKDIGNCMDYTNNPGSSSTPDDSNFMYLAQLYGGKDVRNNEQITAEDAVIVFGQKEEIVIDTTSSNRRDDINSGTRKLFRGNGSLRTNDNNNLREAFSGIPLSESRVQLDEHTLRGAPASRRRILQADEEAEIHIFEDPNFPEYIVMQHFLLVEPGWKPPA